jgi:transcriptional regulator with AAA-type ATPase domain
VIVATVVSTPLYRLRGKIGRHEKVIELVEGRYSVGSSRQAQLHFPFAGVSREHAVLEVTKDELRVKDLGSTNGTLVNGERVQEAEIAMGAELRLGPVRLRAEAIRPESRLAILLDQPLASLESSTVLSIFDVDKSTLFLGEDGAGQAARWLTCIEGFLERLEAARGDDLGPALDGLGRMLLATGCCVVQWTEQGEPLVLGSWGELHESPSHREARRLTGGKDGHGAGFFDTSPPLSLAVSTRQGRPTLGLMIWGEFPGRLGSSQLLQILLRIIEHGRRGPFDDGALEPVHSAEHPELVFPPGYRPGTSPAMTALYKQMRALLRGDMPVLINGETGVGKEMVARILHDSSARRHGPFIPINCAAVPANLLEAEMFGIERGVATGVEARPGKFQLADGGTLFLDEIGEMPPALQAALLRALQEKEIQPVGGKPRAVDVRVISATNVDLAQHLGGGALRRDLFHRLGGVLEVPPLRACTDDIQGLVEHFLRRFAGEVGVRIRGLTVGAMQILGSYDWPGNIRELEHVICRLVYMSADGEIIDTRHVRRLLREKRPTVDPVARLIAESPSLEMKPLVEMIEKALIIEAARRTGGVKVAMCEKLGLSRNGLDNMLKRYQIDIGAIVPDAAEESP